MFETENRITKDKKRAISLGKKVTESGQDI